MYGWQAGGTHPTEMLSWFEVLLHYGKSTGKLQFISVTLKCMKIMCSVIPDTDEDGRRHTVMVTEPQMGENPLQWIYSFSKWMQNMPSLHHFLVNKLNVEAPDQEGEENG